MAIDCCYMSSPSLYVAISAQAIIQRLRLLVGALLRARLRGWCPRAPTPSTQAEEPKSDENDEGRCP